MIKTQAGLREALRQRLGGVLGSFPKYVCRGAPTRRPKVGLRSALAQDSRMAWLRFLYRCLLRRMTWCRGHAYAPLTRAIDQDDQARMFWPQDKGLADGNGPTTSKKPATELIESPRGATATPKPDAKQDGADKDLLPDKAVGGSGTVPMGDHAESLVRCSDRPGRARGGPAGAADCTPKRVRETAAAQQRCEERRPKHACRAADLAQLWKGSDTDSRHWQLPAAQAGRIASEWGREASGTGRQGEGGRVAAMDPQWGF